MSEDVSGKDYEDFREALLKKKISRRKAISTGAKAAVAAAGVIAVAGVGTAAYYASLPPKEVIQTVTQTATQIQTATQTQTTTSVSTVISSPSNPFQGRKLAVLMLAAGGTSEAVRNAAKPFLDQYGAAITVGDFPFEIYFQRATVEVLAGTNAWDVMWMDVHAVPGFARVGAVTEIGDLIQRDVQELDWDSFAPITKEFVTGLDGKLRGVPYQTNYNVALARKDLFNDPNEQGAFKNQFGYDLHYPTTWVEFNDVIKFFHRPPDLFGYIHPFSAAQASIPAWHTRYFMLSGKGLASEDYTATWLDANGEPTPEAILSLDLMKYQMKFMPEGVLSMDNPDAAAIFTNGSAAVATGWVLFFLPVLGDPKSSKVIGKAEIIPPPGGPKGWAWYSNAGHALGITVTAAKDPVQRELAWTFIKYMTNKKNDVKWILDVGKEPARPSSWSEPAVAQKYPWVTAYPQYATHTASFVLSPFIDSLVVPLINHIGGSLAGTLGTKDALKKLGNDYNDILKPLRDAGTKNTHDLNIPPWSGPDYTEQLKAQIYGPGGITPP